MTRKSPRNRAALEARVAEASSDAEKAWAEFDLASFHDNNHRQVEAIQHYEAALVLGIAGERKAQCLAQLSSSLRKIGRLDDAMVRLKEAQEATSDRELVRFLHRLGQRIQLEQTNLIMEKTARLLLREYRRQLKT